MKIVQYPHPSLKHPGKPLSHIDKKLRLEVGEMFELMYDAKGLGLAATQVALPYQLVVMNLEGNPEKMELEEVYINPTIISRKGLVDDQEGCLSFPGLYAKVKRAKQVTVEAYNLKGEKVTIQAEGMASRAWQHEIDHLNGVVFIERFSPIGRIAHLRDIRSFESKFRRAQESGQIPQDAEIEKVLEALENEILGG